MLQSELIVGLDGLSHCRSQWNQLWADSGARVALHRAESICNWVTTFADASRFRAVVVKDDEKWISAIPMIVQPNRLGRLEGRGVANEWAFPDCFLDVSSASPDRVLAIQAGFKKLGVFSFCSTWCPLEWENWIGLTKGWQAHQRAWTRNRFQVDQLQLPPQWDLFWNSLSKNRRKKLQKSERELGVEANTNNVWLDCFRGTDAQVAMDYFERSLAIEHAGWKGGSYSSIISRPKIYKYFRQNTKELAEAGLLRIYLLRVGDLAIAFDYGYLVQGIYTSHKVSFLPQFADQSPGQLLTAKVIQQLIEVENAKTIDFLGASCEATSRWSNDRYSSGRLMLSDGSFLSEMSVMALGKLIDLAKSRMGY